jgi:CheY-like chemotaxis protein
MKLYDGDRYFHRIPGLLIGRTITGEQISPAINKYIDVISDLTDKLEANFANIHQLNRKANFISNMEVLIMLLKDVYARSLESEATRLLRCSKDETSMPYVQKNMRPFITELLSLSIAMQTAQNLEDEQREESLGKIEVLTNIAKNIGEISNLINEGNDGKAKTILIDLVEFMPKEDDFGKLLNLLRGKHRDEAKTAVKALTEKYDAEVKKMAEADFSKKILAVDDMAEILTFVNSTLKNHYKVIAVPSGKAALKVVETHEPDLFLLDIDMPEMNGFELAKTLRLMPKYENTPLVFLTGNSARERVKIAMSLGCTDFIVKPTTPQTLLTKMSKQFEA